MPNAVQFGAGNIGRGFLGQLLFEGGYETTFVDANASLVEGLNTRRAYPIRLVSEGATENLTVGHVQALNAQDETAVVHAIVRADLVSTAVGVSVLPKIAPVLAAGINARAREDCSPIDILLCENQWHAATLMRELLQLHIAPDAADYFQLQVGLVETVIGRMVPAPTVALRTEDPLLIVAEPYKELPVARAMLRAPAPTLPGLVLADNFEAYEARKLFLHNMGHAALAYLGYPQHEFIWQCLDHPATCQTALTLTARAVSAEYGQPLDSLQAFNDDLMRRFANKALGDTVARVAADPLRKLRPNDRLIGAANLCIKHGDEPLALAVIIAAALRYDHPDDASAQELQARRRAEGDAVVLQSVCGLAPDAPLTRLILDAQLIPQG
ncbi:MAG: hypothetical protein M3Y28_07685 [Armatimonadota bacterium]|nr:hypothetical protein [Armatimonadota bacterium]